MRALKGKLDKETQEHKSTTARLEARNRKYADIEGAKSEALKGTHTWINYSDLCKKCSSQSIDVVVKCCTKRNVFVFATNDFPLLLDQWFLTFPTSGYRCSWRYWLMDPCLWLCQSNWWSLFVRLRVERIHFGIPPGPLRIFTGVLEDPSRTTVLDETSEWYAGWMVWNSFCCDYYCTSFLVTPVFSVRKRQEM